jgi:hypothetical protein
LPPIAVFTFGPVAADLAALAEPSYDTVVRLGRTLGFEWLVSLVEIDRPPEIDEPALAVFLREHYALRPGVAPNPYGVRAGKLVRRRPRALPAQLISEFVAGEAGRLEHWGTTLQWLVAPLLSAARGRPKAAQRQQQRAAELLNAIDAPIRVRRLYDQQSEQTLYGLVPTNLYARALLELIELYNDTPPVAICARCKRLFVPQRKGERYCRRYIWPTGAREQIAGCLSEYTKATQAQLASDARRREYKRLQMRVVRLAATHGETHPRTKEAHADFEEWKRTHPVDRGRRPTPIPPDPVPATPSA